MKKAVIIFLFLFLFISTQVFAKDFAKTTEYTVLSLDVQGFDVSDTLNVGWIENDPKMPQIKVKIKPDELKGKVHWTIAILYYQKIRRLVDNKPGIYPIYNSYVFDESTTLNADQQWDIGAMFGDYFCGGDGVITWQYIDENNMSTPIQEFKFCIRGKNPSASQVGGYVGDSPWFAKALAKHESGGQYHQFSLWPERVLGPSTPDIPDDKVIWNEKYLPNASYDKGFGIFQLTNPEPSMTQIWSWKANADYAMSQIRGHLASSKPYFYNLLQRADAKLGSGKAPVTTPINYWNVSLLFGWSFSKTQDDWIFSNNQKTLVDAIAMKRYNGIATNLKDENGKWQLHDFVEWDNANNRWVFYPINNRGTNYVQEVCKDY